MLERFFKAKSFGLHISKPKKIPLNIFFDTSKRSKSFPLMKRSKYKNIKGNKTYKNIGKRWLRIQEGQFLKSALNPVLIG